MANFCGKCGTPINQETGLCPNCDKVGPEVDVVQEEETQPQAEAESVVAPKVTVEEGEPEVQQEKKKVSPRKVLTTILTVVLSILLFVMVSGALGVATARFTVSKTGMKQVTKNMPYAEMLDEITASSADSVFEKVQEKFQGNGDNELSKSEFNEIMQLPEIQEFVSDKVATYAGTIFNSGKEFELSAEEIEDLLKDNSDKIEEITGKKFTSTAYEKAASIIASENVVESVKVDAIKASQPAVYYAVNIGFSYVTLGAFLVVCALIIFGMMKNNVSQGFCGIGVVLTIIGGMTTMFSLITLWIPSILELLCGNVTLALAVRQILKANLLIFGSVLVVGVLTLVIRKVVLKKKQSAL